MLSHLFFFFKPSFWCLKEEKVLPVLFWGLTSLTSWQLLSCANLGSPLKVREKISFWKVYKGYSDPVMMVSGVFTFTAMFLLLFLIQSRLVLWARICKVCCDLCETMKAFHWCWGYFALKKARTLIHSCGAHSSFSSWKLIFFTSQWGQHDSGREVAASRFHSLTSRDYCIHKPMHLLIFSVLQFETAICHHFPWGHTL